MVNTISGKRRVIVIEHREGEVLVECTANLLQTWIEEEELLDE